MNIENAIAEAYKTIALQNSYISTNSVQGIIAMGNDTIRGSKAFGVKVSELAQSFPGSPLWQCKVSFASITKTSKDLNGSYNKSIYENLLEVLYGTSRTTLGEYSGFEITGLINITGDNEPSFDEKYTMRECHIDVYVNYDNKVTTTTN